MGSPASILSSKDSMKYLCKYQVSDLVFMLNRRIERVDYSNILSIEYMCDYDGNMHALLKIILRCDLRLKKWLTNKDFKRDIRAKFDLDKSGKDLNVNDDFVTSPLKCISGVYALFFTDEDEASGDSETNEARMTMNEGPYSYTDPGAEGYHDGQHTIDIYLMNPDAVKCSKAPCNKIYTKSTLQNALAETLADTEHSEIVMSPILNNEVYNELFLPLNPVGDTLIYAEQNYQLYPKGGLFFYDLNTLYILNTDLSKVTAAKENQWERCCIFIPSLNAASPGNGMIKVNGHKCHYVTCTEMEVNTQNFSVGKNAEMGSEARLVITDDTTAHLSRANQSAIDARNEFPTYIKGNQKYAGDIINARMEENETILYLSGNNFDINSFTPNLQYEVCYEDPSKHEKYGKNKYRISYAYHMIKMQSDTYMDSSHRFILKQADHPVKPEKPTGGAGIPARL